LIGIASSGTVLFPPAPGGGTEVTHGYKGKGSLLHLLVDAKGSCLAMTSTGANGNERKELLGLIERVKGLAGKQEMIVVEADKGYDSGELRQELLNRGFFSLIPWRKNVKGAPTIKEVAAEFGLKPIRWVVERTHSWIKRKYRRLMVRWERKSEIWNAMTQLALIMEWVKNLLR
jgi:IS5 family transposase